MSELAGKLVGKHAGPVLVCGGAPNLPSDLEILRAGGFDLDAAIIVSGNEHAIYAGLSPRYIVANDDVHTVLHEHQEPRLRRIAPDAKLCSRHWWADYRHPKMIKANSGMTALLWGAMMGGNPVIAAGFELYRGAECYFHKRWTASSPSMARPDDFMLRQVKELKKLLGDTPLRAVSGPLARHWPKWDPAEKFPEREHTALEQELLAELPGARRVCAATEECVWDGALVPRGALIAATQREVQEALRDQGFVDVTDQPLDEALQARAEQGRREHQRTLALIAKVRNHPRSVRRGIYDADLIRIIRWTEQGLNPRAIQLKCGLPKEQVEFLVKTMGVGNVAEAGQGVGRDADAVQHPADGAAPNHGEGGPLLLDAPPPA